MGHIIMLLKLNLLWSLPRTMQSCWWIHCQSY